MAEIEIQESELTELVEVKPYRPRTAHGKFAPGQPAPAPHVHRKAGSKNKLSRDIRAAALAAASQLGSDGQGTEELIGYFKTHDRVRDEVLLESLPALTKGDVAGSGINANGENERLTILIEAVPHAAFIMPNGTDYADQETAKEAWDKHRAEKRAEQQATTAIPMLKVFDGNDDGTPPAAA